MDTAKFPYYVNNGMEFLRVQEQSGTVRSFWQKEDGKDCFSQQWESHGRTNIRVNDGSVIFQGTVEMGDRFGESYIKWKGNRPDEQVNNGDPSFVGKTYRVYVNVDSIKTVCYDGKYDFNKKYVYTEWDEKGKLKSRGLVFGDFREVYPFKEFKDSEMTEYEYDVKNGAIDKETKKEIHRGTYVNSMKRGYPRDDNPQKVPSSGPNAGGSQEPHSPTGGNVRTNTSIQSVSMRTDREDINRGMGSPIYNSNTNQEGGNGEKVDEGKKEGGNDRNGSDDSTIPVTNRYSSITAIDDIGVNCEYIHLQKCPDCYGDLNFSELSDLVSVVIDDDSLNNALFIKFASMSQLESITIGAGSFTTSGGLSIENCDKLESLKIGPYSFNSATSFKVMNCQNLKSITVGSDTKYSYNFWSCDELVLSSE